MGLSLRPDTYRAASPDGVYMLTHEGSISIRGRSIAQLVDLLAPYLDGRHTLAELTEHLPAQRRELVRKLIALLIERGVVRDLAETFLPGPYLGEAAFVGYFRADPIEAFQRHRRTVSLFLGSGRLLRACAQAARRSGLRHVEVVNVTDGDPGPLPVGDRHVSRATEEAIAPLLDGVGLVVHAADRPVVERAELIDRLCAERGIRLVQAVAADGRAWLGPIGAVPDGGRSWSSGRLRLAARRMDLPGDRPARPGAAGAAAVAARLAQGVLRTGTELVRPDESAMVEIDLTTLESRRCPFLPHPFSRPGGAVVSRADLLRRVAELEREPPLTEEEFSRRAALCARDPAGVVGEPGEGRLAQIPLHVCAVQVSDPVGLAGPVRTPTVTGAGPGVARARYRAVLRALAAYGSLMVDPRRLVTADGRAAAGPGDDPVRVLAALREGRVNGLVWGHVPGTREARLVDAAEAFPWLRATGGTPVPPGPSEPVRPSGPPGPPGPPDPFGPPVGAAAAYSWREAVEAGVVAQCHRLTVAELAAATVPFARLPLDRMRLDARGERYRAMLAVVGEPLEVFDVTGSLGVPAVLCCLDSEPVACASALSVPGAVADALEQALLHFQARENDQSLYAPPAPPRLPGPLRGRALRSPGSGPALDLAAVGAALERRGRRVLAVPLDHDPAVASLVPYIVQVVLVDA
ncbi:hypothetical protein [Streptosporangium sp. NPDC023615]|uniref:hypothetical protein n=1 Tax=Streptosporangium sp. NPDC023615 TaxID=3154794 RepID=UPI0034323C6B